MINKHLPLGDVICLSGVSGHTSVIIALRDIPWCYSLSYLAASCLHETAKKVKHVFGSYISM